MTSEGLGEMFEGDSADTCANKNSLMLIRARVEGLACADPGGKTPISLSGRSSVRRTGSEDPHQRERKFPRCKIQIHIQRDASLSEARHTEYGAMGLIKRAVIYKSRVG